MQANFGRDSKLLDKIFLFSDEFICKSKIDRTTGFAIQLVLEELVTNIIKFSVDDSPQDILVSLERRHNNVIIKLTNHGWSPFDIAKIGGGDSDKHLPNGDLSGLGLHLVRQAVDDISFEHRNGGLIITAIKQL